MFCRNSSGSPSTGRSLVARQRGHRVGRGAEAVHEDQRQRGVVLLAQVQHLPGDDVEEGQPAAHAQQRLGAVHAHRGAEAAVELDHRGRADRGRGVVVGDLDVGQRLHVDRLDRRLGDHPGLAVLEQPVVVREGLDRRPRPPRRRRILSRALFSPVLPMLAIVGLPGGPPQSEPGHDPAARRSGQAGAARPAADRPQPAPAGRASRGGAGASPSTSLAAPEVRRAATVAAYVSIGTEPGTGPLLRRAGAPPASGSCCRCCCPTATWTGPPTPATGHLAPARYGLLEPAGRAARASTRSRPPTWCWCPAWPSSPRGDAARAAAAAPTTGRSAGCRSARSPACCSTTTRSASTVPVEPHDRPVTAAATSRGNHRFAPTF